MYNLGLLFNLGPMEILLLIIIFGLLLPRIFYLKTIQNTLKEVSLENRKIKPSQVWLSLIPFIGIIWEFIIISKVAASLNAEFAKRNLILEEEKPGYKIGLAYCILFCLTIIPAVGILFGILGVILWIIYWVKINSFKSELIKNQLSY